MVHVEVSFLATFRKARFAIERSKKDGSIGNGTSPLEPLLTEPLLQRSDFRHMALKGKTPSEAAGIQS